MFLRVLTIVAVLLFWAFPVVAGVRVTIANDLQPARNVLVEVEMTSSKLPGGRPLQIGSVFLQAGQQQTLPVPESVPQSYNKVTALALHPAYVVDSVSSKSVPRLNRTLDLPLLRPTCWRTLLAAEPGAVDRGLISARAIDDHFRRLLRTYLPAFDQAQRQENLRRYLPLLRKLAALADTDATADSEERHRLHHRLQELEAWLALDQQQRRPLHEWIENFHRPNYVYTRIMQDGDRQTVQEMLRRSEIPGHVWQHSWFNRKTGVKFSFTLERKLAGKFSGYRTKLITDLNHCLGLARDSAYIRKSFPTFIKAGGVWRLQ